MYFCIFRFSLDKQIPAVYNCSSGSLNPIKWKDFNRFGTRACEKFPLKDIMWYPEASLRVNSFIFRTEKALYHSFPGFVVDALAVLRGKKPFLVSDSCI